MERAVLLKEINVIFIDVMDNKDIVLNENTNANNIEEWDSMTNIQIIVGIEKHFKIKFTSSEIQNWKNVGQMIECIQPKLK